MTTTAQQQAAHLYDVEGQTLREVAHAIGVTAPTIAKWLRAEGVTLRPKRAPAGVHVHAVVSPELAERLRAAADTSVSALIGRYCVEGLEREGR